MHTTSRGKWDLDQIPSFKLHIAGEQDKERKRRKLFGFLSCPAMAEWEQSVKQQIVRKNSIWRGNIRSRLHDAMEKLITIIDKHPPAC